MRSSESCRMLFVVIFMYLYKSTDGQINCKKTCSKDTTSGITVLRLTHNTDCVFILLCQCTVKGTYANFSKSVVHEMF